MEQDEEEEEATTEKHSRGFGRFIPTPVPLQQLTSGISNVRHQVTNVTHQVTHQVTAQVAQVTQLTTDLIQRGLSVCVYWVVYLYSMVSCVHRVVSITTHHLLMSSKSFRDMLTGLKFMTTKGITI